ncbi:hypothetical protein JOD54_006056 [Actinokineospora baliensis]|uniref:hypothetical protein n=1 Tax=Actinokineospora baliensis TaxID=547056 RepID=UPI00195C9822|nr:hypothetical protein [Actinokineospora baliensis]MBM7775852.1 hypothetical protein [Actinokineospora baliensis]
MTEPVRHHGATPEINDLADFLGAHTAALTEGELCARFGNWAALWAEYRSGERIVPWHLLHRVIDDQVPDRLQRLIAVTQARTLYDRAEASAARIELATTPPARRTLAVTALATALAALIATGLLRRTPLHRKASHQPQQ